LERPLGALLLVLLLASCASLREPAQERFSDHAPRLKEYAALSQALYRGTAPRDSQILPVPYDGLLGPGRSSYLLATDDRKQMHTVVIRGTGTVQDLGLGLDILPTRDRALGLELHNGFRQLALAVRTDLLPRLKDGYAIGVGGHSAGGAAAQILALYLANVDKRAVSEVYTFGQPKFSGGEPKGLATLEDRTVRVINCDDAIPMLPNPPSTGTAITAYRHGGPILFLGDDGRVWFSRSDVELDDLEVVGRNILREVLLGRPFRSHLIESYVERLKTAREDPVAADYGKRSGAICS
jgi:hypothetical protein